MKKLTSVEKKDSSLSEGSMDMEQAIEYPSFEKKKFQVLLDLLFKLIFSFPQFFVNIFCKTASFS